MSITSHPVLLYADIVVMTIDRSIRNLTTEEKQIFYGAVILAQTELGYLREIFFTMRPFYDGTAQTAYIDMSWRVGLSHWFFRETSPAERAFVISHEALHALGRHHRRTVNFDPVDSQVCADLEVNTTLMDSMDLLKITAPEGLLRPANFGLPIKKSLEFYWQKFQEKKDQMGSKQQEKMKPYSPIPPQPSQPDDEPDEPEESEQDGHSQQGSLRDDNGNTQEDNDNDQGQDSSQKSSDESAEGDSCDSTSEGAEQSQSEQGDTDNSDEGSSDDNDSSQGEGGEEEGDSSQNGSEGSESSSRPSGSSGDMDSMASGDNGSASSQEGAESDSEASETSIDTTTPSTSKRPSEGRSRGYRCDEMNEERRAAIAEFEASSPVEIGRAASKTIKTIEEEISSSSGASLRNAQALSSLVASLTAPKVDWKKQFQRLVSAAYTDSVSGRDQLSYKKVNRRSDGNIILPGRIDYEPTVIFGLDISGSMGKKKVLAAVSEAEAIVTKAFKSKRKVLFFTVSTDVQNMSLVSSFEDLDLSLGGGTRMSAGFHYVTMMDKKARPDVFVLGTDGELFGEDVDVINDIVRSSPQMTFIMLVISKELPEVLSKLTKRVKIVLMSEF